MRILIGFVFILMAFFIFPPHSEADTSAENVIIYFKEEIDDTIIEKIDGEVEKKYTLLPAVAATATPEIIKEIEKSEEVLAVEPDQIVKVNNQKTGWGIHNINARQAWAQGLTGKGIKIAVLDTGISQHNDLIIAGGVSFTSYTHVDDHGHGTHVAGIIGAKDNDFGVVGVAPDAEIYAVKVLGQDGTGKVSDVIAGVEWAVANNMDIINLSLGTPNDSPALKRVIDYAYEQGILVIAAGGNNGLRSGSGDNVDYPARFDSVMAVAAINKSNERASFSATGNTIEIAGPGVEILSTDINNRYSYRNGTSMAASYVTGVAALLKELYPHYTNKQLRKYIHEIAIDIGEPGRDTHYGYGLVQAIPKEEKILTLKEGDRKAEVVQLKLDLEKAGYLVSTNPTEFFGPITTSRLKEFQADFGLPVTGEADSTTLKKLTEVAGSAMVLKEGDRRPEVIQLKLDLERVGYFVSVNPTEYYGPLTTARVREFQSDFGLRVTGEADGATLRKLAEAADSAMVLKEGDRRPEVIQLKIHLERVGYFVSVNPTEYYGPLTTARVKEFQSDFGLRVTGEADGVTLRKLAEAADSAMVLKEGDRRPEVIQLKLDLERVGYFVSVNPTEYYGPVTTAKVREFQSDFGLRVTGEADGVTLRKLTEATANVVVLKEGDRRPEVIQLKMDLQQAGYQVSKTPTEFYGPITTSRVREFQLAYGLRVTGKADMVTQRKLREIN
ncbi:peptidoglycan-binding protein [Evansella clarkii]|uniref:peptidoglycan-binding protein n=1 Tax=Evansella clarkii TaxID=79879 RepID=UPI001430496D|nr:peptidoglycan-binding protein [Evansella clarkii]